MIDELDKDIYGLGAGDLVMWNHANLNELDPDMHGIVIVPPTSGSIQVLMGGKMCYVTWNQIKCVKKIKENSN